MSNVSKRRISLCSRAEKRGEVMNKPSIVFARLRAFARSWLERRLRRGGFSVIRLSVIGLVIGLSTLSVSVLPTEIAIAATSPNISAPPNVVVGEAAGSVTLPVILSVASTSTVTVNYATPSGGGCNSLFQGKSGTLTFSPGVTSQSVTITLNNCGVSYTTFPDFTFTLSSAVNGNIVNPLTQVDIISDATTVATPGLYVRNAVVDNTAGNVMVPVLLGGPIGTISTSTVTVNYTTANGSAIAGTDYTTTSGTLTFGPGQTAQNIVVPIIDRSGAAASRSFSVNLSSPTNSVITNGTGVVTIGASGGTPVSSPNISAPANTVVGEANGYLDLPVTLSAPGTSNVTVNYTAPGGGGCNALFQSESGTLTFVPGQTLESVRVPLNNCGVSYTTFPDFTFTLSSAVNGNIVNPLTQVDIISDATTVATPGLYVRNAVVDNTAGNVMVPVLLGGPIGTISTSTVTVNYTTANGSAIAGTDYTTTSGTLTFGPGQTAQNIVVPIIDRSGAAASRSFSVNLSSPTNSVITNGTGVVTIGASGGTPVSSPNISAPANTVVGEANGYLDLPVTLSAPGTSNVTVNYTAPGGGGCNALFQSESGTLTFVPGQTLESVRVPLNNCGVSYTTFPDFTFTLSSAVNGNIVNPITQVDIISDATTVATPGLYVRNAVVDNTAGNVMVPVLLGGPIGTISTSTVTVNYTTANGSAIAGTDYTTTSGTLTFGPGQTAQNIVVPIIDRSGAAASRSFSVNLSSPTNSVITNGTGVVTIGASGGTPVSSPNISAPANTVVGEANGYLDLPVTLSAPGTSNVTVNYTAPGGGGCNALFQSESGTLTFVPGQTLESVRVPLNNCGVSYTTFPDFTFTLSSAVNGNIVNPITQVDIISDATTVATPGLYVRNAVVDNTAGNVMVPVLLGGPIGTISTSTVTVNYTTANGSAIAGTDYTTTSGTLTFGPGQTAQNIVVPIIDRSGAAASRSFSVNLSSPTNSVITNGTGVVTIGASGGTPVSSPNISAPANTVVGEANGYLDLPVTLSAPGTSNVTVNYTAPGGGGCNALFQSESGTLTFVPGQTLESVRVPLNNCGVSAGGSFTFTLSSAGNGTISNPSTTLTIEGPPTITKFNPTSGPPGTIVTIKGTNLEGAISVTFNGKKAKISSDTATTLKVKVPAKGTTGKIIVTTQDGSVTSTTNFQVT